jgi:hypothetical protein
MKNAKTVGMFVVLGLAMIFSYPFVAQAKKPLIKTDGGESQAGGLPALEDRLEADEAIIATALHRLSADFQNDTSLGVAGEEITTNATPAAGGLLTYSKTLSIPYDVAYITFSAQGDAHFGSALLMQASITDSLGTETVCQPLAGQIGFGGGGPHLFPGWYTLLHLPEPTASTDNCNDGLGGTADCHDNNLMFSCCERITPDTGATSHTVKIRMADLPGGALNFAFYERSTIYIDASMDPPPGTLCSGHGTP